MPTDEQTLTLFKQLPPELLEIVFAVKKYTPRYRFLERMFIIWKMRRVHRCLNIISRNFGPLHERKKGWIKDENWITLRHTQRMGIFEGCWDWRNNRPAFKGLRQIIDGDCYQNSIFHRFFKEIIGYNP